MSHKGGHFFVCTTATLSNSHSTQSFLSDSACARHIYELHLHLKVVSPYDILHTETRCPMLLLRSHNYIFESTYKITAIK